MDIIPLQQQFPLSQRKFWKKILPASIISLFFSGIASPIITMIWTGFLDSHLRADATIAIPAIIVTGIVLFIIAMSLYASYIKAYIKRYYYSTDNYFITIKKGVFTPTEIHVQYAKIQDVYVDQDITDRIFGLYDVHIASATAGSAIEAHIDGVNKENAERLKSMFMNSIRNGGNSSNGAPTSLAPQQSQPTQINLTEDFSSATYPLEARWMYANIISSIFGAFWTVLIITSVFFSPSRTGRTSLAQNLGYGYGLTNDLLIAIVVALAFVFFHIIYLIIWKRNYQFQFTQEYIFTHEGVISTKETHTPYGTIQDVIIQQGIVDRIFGLYKVMIQNAANNTGSVYTSNRGQLFQGIIIPGQTKERANKLADFLRSTVLVKNTGRTGL